MSLPASCRRRGLLAAALLGGLSARASAAASSPWPDLPRLQGAGSLRFLGLTVYDARLWVGPRFDAQHHSQSPLGLEITYRRAIAGQALVDRSLDEITRCGPQPPESVQRWRGFMTQAFPDVGPGDRLLGLWRPAEGLTRLDAPASASRAARSSELQDAAFGPCFFGIWLAPHSSEPALRQRLLGLGP